MRLANDIAAAAMEHVQGVIRPGMTEAQAAAEWLGFVHGEGTGWAGKVELALGFSLVWSGDGIRTFTATASTARRRGRADAVRDLGLRRRLLVRPHEEPRRRGALRPVSRARGRADGRLRRRGRVLRSRGEPARARSAGPRGHRGDRLPRAAVAPDLPRRSVPARTSRRMPTRPAAARVHEGMVLAIEPGCYWEGGGGLRVEDNFLITAAGAEKLSRFPDGIVQA